MKQENNIRTRVTSKILQIGFLDVGLCKEEILFKCFIAFFLNKLGIGQQGSHDRKPNQDVNFEDVQRESVN